MLSLQQKQLFDDNGYLKVEHFLDKEEVALLNQAVDSVPDLATKSIRLKDAQGDIVNLTLWNEAGDDIFGALVRCERMVNALETLLDGEVYHYHSKLNVKYPNTKGNWDWHQDYGYWYDNGMLYPNMASVMVALSPSVKDNGCLQLIEGSHKMGRINHQLNQHQQGADMLRVNEVLKIHKRIYAEMQAGDALFFHCNTLHCSEGNDSAIERRVIISSFNRADNSAYREHQHPNYVPLLKMPNDAIKTTGLENFGSGRTLFPQPDGFDID